jgi:8-oxo-dGTP diphosphatase
MVDTALLQQLITNAASEGVRRLIVGAVVQHNGKVLLLKRPEEDFMGGIFELPSGNVEPGENLHEALRREVQEETGLKISAIREYLGHFDYLSGSGKPTRQFNFAVDVDAAEPIELTEHDAHLWASPTDEPPVTDAVKEILARYR